MAKPYVVSAAARSMGYFDTDTIKTAYQNLKHAELMNRILRKRIPSKQDWTEDEKQAFYKEHIDQFMAKKPVRFKQIFTHDKETIDKALARLKAGDDFDAVAAALGEGSTDDNPDNKATAVEPGWVSEKDIPKELFDRAWVTNVGNVSAPIKTKYGYHIVKVLEKRPRLPYVSAGTALMRAMREDAYKTTDAQWRKWVSEGVDTERYDKIFAKIDFNNPWKYVTPTSTPPEEQPDTLQISKSDTLAAGGSN
jgi:parvulin-like peptidyl-prolyl isomerase